jgi:hypothetical protein
MCCPLLSMRSIRPLRLTPFVLVADCHIAPEWPGAVCFRIADSESAGEPIVIHGPLSIPVFLGGIRERFRREEQDQR